MPENWHLSCYHKAKSLGNGDFSLEANFSELPPMDTPIVFMHGNRVAPGIFIDIEWSKRYRKQDTGAAVRLGDNTNNNQVEDVE